MKYYSEETVRQVLKHFTDDVGGHIYMMEEAKIKLHDRERIRMELWKDCYVMHSGSVIAHVLCSNALEAFDKQFPNV